ncbi:MAG TPA: hypothetical protein PLY90_01300 [Candidatus Hydrogenedentes bacterium]|nr:hypothetical protein [Candidatus Hydrogenedentota bacterium]HOD95338.1 hypothetical protein [Candidatus Hydrogenedentota bacterium]HOM47594.1 hypothetical protein [Candidatus Hydrogenedentota bacterium]HOR50910.1 hypothetical protein [Candidatus Hydrogenedentota bacterium]HPK24601.1 hypothetical protein [Candidatus Hydrogenedentota bacterium]
MSPFCFSFQTDTRHKRHFHRAGTLLLFIGLAGLLFVGMFSGCSCREKEDPPRTPPAAPPQESKETDLVFYAPVKTVDRAGNPLRGMLPIATRSPNAFDKPLAQGKPTDADGLSSIRFALTEKIALRAWDPQLFFFPNNFFDVLPGSGNAKDPLVVVMVEAGTLEAVLILPDGTPAAGENVGLMMFHPVHGPWWPAEAESNEKGEVVFPNLPPGSFILRLKVESGATLETPEQYIAPGENTHMGVLYLKAPQSSSF